jgi:hypothetical protein
MRKLIALLLAGLLVAGLVGCSSSDDKSEDVKSEGATTTDKDDSNKDDKSSTEDDTDSTDGDLGDLNALGGECLTAATAFLTLGLAPLTFLGGATDEQIKEFEDSVAEVEANIPEEIKDDFETVGKAYREYAEELRGLSGDILDPEYGEQVEAAAEKLETPEFEEANARIEQYFEENCS